MKPQWFVIHDEVLNFITEFFDIMCLFAIYKKYENQ